MIFQILQNGLGFSQNFILLTVMTAVILGSITVHELAHGYVSYLQGDPTAKNAGRLTLNPFKHLDKIGTVCMLFCGFGWAKPVPIDPRYYKNPKRQTALTAAAGPAINLFIGVSATVQLTVLAWLWETGLYVAVPLVRYMSVSAYAKTLKTGRMSKTVTSGMYLVSDIRPMRWKMLPRTTRSAERLSVISKTAARWATEREYSL